MNERIRELAEQATQKTMGWFDPKAGELDVEKFAELIVTECIQVIQNESMDSGDEWEDGLCMAEDAIKHHFGVDL